MKTVFISRTLSTDSTFQRRLTAAGWRVLGCSLVQFRPVPVAEVPPADWYFFYSPRGVQFLCEQASPPGKIATIGARTARELAHWNRAADFIGTGNPTTTTARFRAVLRAGETVCFVQARRSRRSVAQSIGGQVNVRELVVYDNELLPTPLPRAEVLVFTSPLNVDGFLLENTFDPAQQLISIGPTTTQHLIKCGHPPHRTAPAPDETTLAALVLEIPT